MNNGLSVTARTDGAVAANLESEAAMQLASQTRRDLALTSLSLATNTKKKNVLKLFASG